MTELAMRLTGIGKQYVIGADVPGEKSLRETIIDTVAAPVRWVRRGGHRPPKPTIWALKDVTFDVKVGEVVGLIGRNGAGKSTLLKILSRITEPTTGSAELYGRVGSLLEVGMGFHGELTGRENIFLNGAILGMKHAETLRNFDEIVAFAELEKFIDTPVKRYSSGMYLRLAFAVAAYLQSEILLVDEVLAVGDVVFQKKCLGKIGDIARAGRTVFFVSHNMAAVQNLCTRGICLRPGGVAADGPVATAIGAYLSELTDGSLANTVLDRIPRPDGMGEKLRFTAARFEGVENSHIPLWSPMRLRLEFEALEKISGLSLGLSVYSMDREHLFTCEAADSDQILDAREGRISAVCIIPDPQLAPARYVVDLKARGDRGMLDSVPSAITFEIEPFGVAPWSTDRRFRPTSEWSYQVPSEEGAMVGSLG